MNILKITIFIAFICFIFPFGVITAHAAVSSVGEINVEGNDQGKVLASSKATLIGTLIIDRSLAEPGEEIKTIEFALPTGFTANPKEVIEVLLNAKAADYTPNVSGASLRIELVELILDVNTIAQITFKVSTPSVTTQRAAFRVRLRNFWDDVIGDYVRSGQADGKKNNDSFTLTVIPNIPPPTPTGVKVQTDPTGENDVIITWEKSTDSDVSGYSVYRDNDWIKDVVGVEAKDRDVPAGTHTYTIEAYKGTKQLISPKTLSQTVNVGADLKAPEPPVNFTIKLIADGVKLEWEDSPTADVVQYVVSFDTFVEYLERKPNQVKYDFTDRRTLKTGRFIYTVEAVDEAGNKSSIASQELRISNKPYPNPFTPLSSNPRFNRVTFSARGLEEAEGEFTVKIYDIDGGLVKELITTSGEQELNWDGKNEDGELVESGVYIYQLQVGERYATGTVVVAK